MTSPASIDELEVLKKQFKRDREDTSLVCKRGQKAWERPVGAEVSKLKSATLKRKPIMLNHQRRPFSLY